MTTDVAPGVASLAMYALPELEAANDALWAGLAARLIDQGVAGVPEHLTRGRDLTSVWLDPNLLLAQTCGYPLMTRLAGQVTLLATPHYSAEGCGGPLHRSAIIVRQNDSAGVLADLRGRRCAINEHGSNSGMNLLRHQIAPLAGGEAFFAAVLVTGAHAASAQVVAQGEADVAAIDCVTWAHLQRFRSETTQRLRVLAWTAATPSIPLITAGGADAGRISALINAIEGVAADPALGDARKMLLLEGFSRLPLERYQLVLDLKADAVRVGYPILR